MVQCEIFWRLSLLEPSYREIKLGCPEELIYADDLAFTDGSLESLTGRLEVWNGVLESKQLRLNFKKTKMTISHENWKRYTEERFYVFCSKNLCNNFILRQFCRR